MKTLTYLTQSLFIFSILFIVSCSKSADTSATATSDDNSTAEGLFEDVYESTLEETISMDALTSSSRSITDIQDDEDCKTVTTEVVDSATHHIIRTVDFGEGCTTTNNGIERTKKGKIIIEKMGKRRETGFSLNISFDEFYVNDYQVEGTKTVSNGLNDANQITHTIAVTSTITSPEGNSMTYSSSRVRTLIEGGDTDERSDDVWQITGTSSGTNFDGEAYSKVITTPLIKKVGCFYISEGVVEISPAGKSTRTLDYGTRDNCDNVATVTVDGETTEIEVASVRKKRGKRRFRRR